MTRHRVGKGTVYYCAEPLEWVADETGAALRPLYAWFLHQAQVEPLGIIPDDPQLHVFAQKTRLGRAHVVFNSRKGTAAQNAALPTAAGEIALGVKDRYPALAAVTDAGQVLALGGYQHGAIDREEVLRADDLATVVALDGNDIRRSRALLVLPFAPGIVELRAAKAWKRPVVLYGDLHGGRFRTLETITAPAGVGITLELDPDRATLMALVCERRQVRRWQELLSTLAVAPQEFAGY
jgi:hypothetical protein